MNNHIYKRETPEHIINWPEATFYAEATGEQFQELTVTTLKSEYNDLCQETAFGRVKFENNNQTFYNNIRKQAIVEMDSGNLWVRESITIDNDYNVKVCLDCDAVTDTEIDIALSMLEEILQDDDLQDSFHAMGEWIQFTSDEILSVIHNENDNN